MNKSNLDLINLKNCISTLKNCPKDYKASDSEIMKEYIADACIKRYEYTVEIAWKMMKKFLKLEYGKKDEELTINNIFRFIEGYGFIHSWVKWREYYDRRNDISHEYNQVKALVILGMIDDLVEDCEFLYKKLQDKMEK